MIDVILLRLMKSRKEYSALVPMLSEKVVDDVTRALIDNFGRYFKEYPSHDKIDWPTFVPQFVRWNPGIKPEKLKEFGGIFNSAMKDADEDQKRNVISDLAEMGLGTELANYVTQWQEGELDDILGAITQATDKYKKRVGFKLVKYIDTPIEELMLEETDTSGLQWRLSCLRASMRGLRGGDFGIVAGRPDKGKTSFIASEIVHLAAQLPSDKNVVWLNNEGPGKRIIPRLYQAALEFDMTDMKVHSQAGQLRDLYVAKLGRLDRIRVIDIHGLNNTQVDMLIEDNKAGLAVFDMIDNIQGFGDAARTDLGLERMYQWARERMVHYDCVGLATSQISADGDGLMFPVQQMLKDSKTGKQGACDFQIMIGASHDPLFDRSRFIGVVKNKLRHPTGPGDPKAEVQFLASKSLYKDMPMLHEAQQEE